MSVVSEEVGIEERYINGILSSIAFALLYYDYVLTFPLEVDRYWFRGYSWASFLFFLNRYMSILGHIPVIVEFFGFLSQSECRKIQQYHRVFSAITQGVVAVLLTMRTYALYNRSRRILIFLATLACACGIFTMWMIIADRNPKRPQANTSSVRDGCDLTLSQQEGHDLALAWSGILVFDAAVFVLTLIKTLEIGRRFRGGYVEVMLRDGAIYFGILFVCYLSNILAYAFAQPVHKGVSTSITNVTSTTLVTRLMLNIRDPRLAERPRRFGGGTIELVSNDTNDSSLQFWQG